jgi:hypothetical protein
MFPIDFQGNYTNAASLDEDEDDSGEESNARSTRRAVSQGLHMLEGSQHNRERRGNPGTGNGHSSEQHHVGSRTIHDSVARVPKPKGQAGKDWSIPVEMGLAGITKKKAKYSQLLVSVTKYLKNSQ